MKLFIRTVALIGLVVSGILTVSPAIVLGGSQYPELNRLINLSLISFLTFCLLVWLLFRIDSKK